MNVAFYFCATQGWLVFLERIIAHATVYCPPSCQPPDIMFRGLTVCSTGPKLVVQFKVVIDTGARAHLCTTSNTANRTHALSVLESKMFVFFVCAFCCFCFTCILYLGAAVQFEKENPRETDFLKKKKKKFVMVHCFEKNCCIQYVRVAFCNIKLHPVWDFVVLNCIHKYHLDSVCGSHECVLQRKRFVI